MCDKREKLFEFILEYKTAHDGNSPTYREMMAATGLTTTSMVAWHLEKLEAEGRIERPQQVGNSRVIEVVGGEWCYDRRPETEDGQKIDNQRVRGTL
jgi:SOS-response transcriptional repressor LexA